MTSLGILLVCLAASAGDANATAPTADHVAAPATVNVPESNASAIRRAEREAAAHATAQRYSEAAEAWKNVVADWTRQAGPDHWETVHARVHYAHAQVVARATPEQQQSISNVRRATERAKSLCREGKVTEGMRELQIALDGARALWGEVNVEYVRLLTYQARSEYYQFEFAKSATTFQRVIDLEIKLYGAAHPAVAESQDWASLVQAAAEDFVAADELAQSSLSIIRQTKGVRSLEYAGSLTAAGRTKYFRGNWSAAKQLLLQAQEIYKLSGAEESIDYCWTCERLTTILIQSGDFHEALAENTRAIQILDALNWRKSPRDSVLAHRAKILIHLYGDTASAARLLEAAIEGNTSNQLSLQYSQMAALQELATVYSRSGDSQRAEECFSRCRAWRSKYFGNNSLQFAYLLLDSGRHYRDKEELPRAQQEFESALKIVESKAVEEFYKVPFRKELAQLYVLQGDHDRADGLLKRVSENVASVDKYSQGDIARTRAEMFTGMRRLEAADKFFTSAAECYEASVGQYGPELLNCLRDHATMLEAAGKADRATAIRQRVARAEKEVAQINAAAAGQEFRR